MGDATGEALEFSDSELLQSPGIASEEEQHDRVRANERSRHCTGHEADVR